MAKRSAVEIKLKDKVAIVTGAGSGIGKAITLGLAKEGAKLVLADLRLPETIRLAKKIEQNGIEALAVGTDISDVRQVDKLIRIAIEKFASIDIVINNAGICSRTKIPDISGEEWDRVLGINLKGAFLVSQRVLPYMKGQRYGRIINIVSSAGKIGGIAVGAHYAASKAGLICLTKSLAREGAAYGINVNAVCPGVIETEMTTSLPKAKLEAYRKQIPLGRIGKAEEVVDAVLFLASDRASYITGEVLDVDGGLVMD